MHVADQLDRSSIPRGMVRQKAIGSPRTWVSIPARRRWAVTASPCGPAPITATAVSVMSSPGETGVPRSPAVRAVEDGGNGAPEDREVQLQGTRPDVPDVAVERFGHGQPVAAAG